MPVLAVRLGSQRISEADSCDVMGQESSLARFFEAKEMSQITTDVRSVIEQSARMMVRRSAAIRKSSSLLESA